jgi:hypothetical protein
MTRLEQQRFYCDCTHAVTTDSTAELRTATAVLLACTHAITTDSTAKLTYYKVAH